MVDGGCLIMKKKFSMAVIIGSALFAGILAAGTTLAWFGSQAFIHENDSPIEGSVTDKYYDRGTGTSQDPYIIKLPRHIYNLAWLQYLGFYNKNDGTTDDHQFYFKLEANIDMGSMGAIPPIGTETNPFVGNFDGDGYVVSNVTISNSFSDYRYHPSVMNNDQGVGMWNNSNHLQPHVLGFFGVVGYQSNSANRPTSYSSAVNEFKNTALTGVNVKTVLTDSLVGVAAGLVFDTTPNDANTVLNNVVVDNSKITLPNSATTAYSGTSSFTTNVSDYTLVGYTNTKRDSVKASKTTYGINMDTNVTYSAAEEGNVAGWGGSIDMKEMYTNLDTIWKGFSKRGRNGGTIPAIQYPADKEVFYDKDGVLDESKTVETNLTAHRVPRTEGGLFPAGSNTRYHSYYNYEHKDSADNKQTASYGFIIEETTNNEEDFMCLTGNKEVTITNVQSLTTHYYDSFYGRKISTEVNGTTYYLKANGTNDVTATSQESEASLWEFSNGTIYTAINEVQYFLNRNGVNTVNIGTTSNTTWTRDNTYNGFYTTYNNTNYYLNCATSDWNLTTIIPSHVLLSDGDGHYIAHPSGNTNGEANSSTDSSNQTTWWVQSGSNFASYSSNTRFLRSSYSTNIGNNTTSDQPMYINTTNSRRFAINDGYLYTTYTANSRTHYVYAYFNGTTWRETIATGNQNPPANRTAITVENIPTSLSEGASDVSLSTASSTATYIARSRVDTVDAKVEVNHTFFPLRQEETKPGVPASTNTGYVVSGANYWGDPYGDIRVSKYERVYTSGTGWNQETEYRLETSCFDDGSFIDVKTINAEGNSVSINNNSGFKKYEAAKTSMEKVLNADNNIYGLHFMNADIHYGGDNPVVVEKAIVNGQRYNNYELPTDCVDFSLKEKGFINFFAGTYYPDNNCFFSLHEVFRNGSTIDDVKEIVEIYEDPNDTSDVKSYVYKYSNNKFSLPFTHQNGEKVKLDGSPYPGNSEQDSKPSAYSKLAFATSRIKQNSLTDDYAYYFEIPMHEGEYCLGSVSGCNGAYLMYLDIAANASKVNRTAMYQKFAIVTTTYDYPAGVSLGSLAETYAAGVKAITTDIDASDSACMLIKINATGVFGIDRNENDVALSRAQEANAPPIYAADTIIVHEKDDADELSITPLTTTDEIIKQMTYYDYMVISDSTIVTTVIDRSTDGGNSFVRSYIKQETYGGTDFTKAPTSTYIYDENASDADNNTNLANIKIYKYVVGASDNGRKFTDTEVKNVAVLNITDSKLSNEAILTFKWYQDGDNSYTDFTKIDVAIDSSMRTYGTYFTYSGVTITITPNGDGEYIIKVTDYKSTFTLKTYNIGSNNPNTPTSATVTTVITINGETITGAPQIITGP